MRRAVRLWLVAFVAIGMIAVSLVFLESDRSGVSMTSLKIGTTPATLYRHPASSGPMVVVAHGFAGSRQLMEAYSLTLAQSGYQVLAFDFEGHGRNPVPMSGDVTSIDGTTALLVAETRRVIAAARDLQPDGMALLGHSMATDVIVRAAAAERLAGRPVDAVVAVSMYSEAVSPSGPARLLIITGEWEPSLRRAALAALRLVDPDAVEGETVRAGEILRRAAVAPNVEHVGVLFSPRALGEARSWLDDTFARAGSATSVTSGQWILLLLAGIVLLFRPLVSILPPHDDTCIAISTERFWAAIVIPALVVPLIATQLRLQILPTLVADYLALHFILFGVIQLMIFRVWRLHRARLVFLPIAVLAFWGIGVFGFAMDRYAASFFPNVERLPIILALLLGAVPAMVADAYLTGSGRGRLWKRVAARLAFLASLVGAALLDPHRLQFLILILPVLLLFLLVHGQMGRWIARRCGPEPAGIGLGLCLAWALGVTFPLFVAP